MPDERSEERLYIVEAHGGDQLCDDPETARKDGYVVREYVPASDLDRLTREKQEAEREADALRAVGAQMANLCYNLAQRAAIEPRNCEIMRDLARRWDDIPHRSDVATARASSPSPESVT